MNDILNILIDFFAVLSALGKGYVEIRFLKTQHGLVSGLFKTDKTGAEALVSEISRLSLHKISMYHTINKLSRNYVERYLSENKINILYTKVKSVTKDADIGELKLIMVDLDPKREAGVSSTEEEKAKANELMNAIVADLSKAGLGKPAYVTDSGNGYNAYYPVSCPVDNKSKKIIADFISTVSKKYSNEFVDVDTTTKNPSRIAKVPGSWSVKGESTAERPHRQCQLTESNVDQEPLTAEQIRRYIESQQPSDDSSGKVDKGSRNKTRRILDIPDWLDHYNIEYRAEDKEYQGEPCTMYILKECPFDIHDNEYCSFLSQFSNGNTIFSCHHNHCTQDINDFIEKFPLLNDRPPLLEGDKPPILVYNNIIQKAQLFKNKNNANYLMLNDKLYNFDSAECIKAISKEALTSVGSLLSNTAITTVHSNICSLFDDYSSKKDIGTRTFYNGHDYYYAVTPEKILHVNDKGTIEYASNCPVYFAYDPDFINQPEPDLTSPAADLPKLVETLFNITEKDRSRFLAQLCAFYLPDLITPFLVLSGGHGTSKTTSARKIISLVNPTSTDIISMPEKEDGLIASLAGSYITAFDNIDSISKSFSDILCISCTGGYSVKRKLYSDNAKARVYLKNHVILNGIGDFVSRPDLAERCNIIYLDTIQKRLTEKQVWKEFDELKPKLLGSIFNTIAAGLTLLPEMEKSVTEFHRMADFSLYGAAFIKAMGLSPEEFIDDYTQANTQLIADCSSADPFNSVIKSFVENNSGKWTGTATKLLEALKSSSTVAHSVVSKYSASILSRKLSQNSTDLKAVGVNVDIKSTTPKSITLTTDNTVG